MPVTHQIAPHLVHVAVQHNLHPLVLEVAQQLYLVHGLGTDRRARRNVSGGGDLRRIIRATGVVSAIGGEHEDQSRLAYVALGVLTAL
jgi:hypothetical protein